MPPLGFRLAFDDGRAMLDLSGGVQTGLARVERLRLEVPDLRYPFDLTAGLSRFQSRRCLLRELVVSLDTLAVTAWLDQAPLERYGLHHPWLETGALGLSGLRLALRAELGGRVALVTGRVEVVPREGGGVRAEVRSARAYGFLPVPVPLVFAGLFTALGATAAGQAPGEPDAEGSNGNGAHGGAGHGLRWWSQGPALLRMPGATALETAAVDLLLYPLLAGRGWRLPERRGVELGRIVTDADQVRLSFIKEGPAAFGTEDPEAPEAAELLSLGEEALSAGQMRAAREAYRHAAASSEGGQAEERLLALLLASTETLDAAAEEAEAQLGRRPDDAGALLGRAVVAGERGEPTRAAECFRAAADRLESAGERLEAACARHAATEALERAGEPAQARAELQRALDGWPELRSSLRRTWEEKLQSMGVAPVLAPVQSAAPQPTPEALRRARTHWAAGDLGAAAREYEALLAERGGGDSGASAEAHLRLAQWARLNGQMMVATRRLSSALKLEPARGAPVPVLVEVLEAFGRTDDLQSALSRRRKRASDADDRRDVARALGAVLERSGRAPEAVAVYEELLEDAPEDLQTLSRLAEIHRRESRHADLARTLERLFTLTAAGSRAEGAEEDGEEGEDEVPRPSVEAVGLELAQLYEETLDDRERAAAVLERLCAACPESEEAREALAALDRRPAGAED